MQKNPALLNLHSINSSKGILTVVENAEPLLPFVINRVYWITDVSEGDERGGHAHLHTQKLYICLKGKIEAYLEDLNNNSFNFVLKSSEEGLLVPSMFWNKMTFQQGAILLCLASEVYSESDYIRDYNGFKKIKV